MKKIFRQSIIAATFIGAIAFTTTGIYAQVINTRIGKIETINGFPTAEAAQKIFEESDFQRASQANYGLCLQSDFMACIFLI
jgi:hypothetical protein